MLENNYKRHASRNASARQNQNLSRFGKRSEELIELVDATDQGQVTCLTNQGDLTLAE